jgi:hypothetical protein
VTAISVIAAAVLEIILASCNGSGEGHEPEPRPLRAKQRDATDCRTLIATVLFARSRYGVACWAWRAI